MALEGGKKFLEEIATWLRYVGLDFVISKHLNR